MALIVRIDVDRPYGKHPALRHLLSRLSSDLWFPKISGLGYLAELNWMLRTLNDRQARAYVFFRRCTLPSPNILELLRQGGHVSGLHLENSRSFATFSSEKALIERHLGAPVLAVSKHGSGKARYGCRHYAPYEPAKYVEWARRAGMKLLLGNLEDPSLEPERLDGDFVSFPSAFWLEPSWRDTKTFSIDWLISRARIYDTVLLVHPENVLESAELTRSFKDLLGALETRILP
jgi:hypothetical protein